MAELLSQQEIDSLLNNIKAGDVSQYSEDSSKEAVPFDFRLPNRISKNQLRSIRSIHDSFAESFNAFLVSKLQTMVNINCTTIDQLYYSEYVLSVSNPACLYTFDIKDTDIKGILELGTDFTFSLVDRLLGGNGNGMKESPMVTPIEQKVLLVIVEQIMKDLAKAWSTIETLEFEIEKFESDIDFARITTSNESVLLVSYELIIDEVPFMMNITYATFAFERILSNLSSKSLTSIRPTNYAAGTAKDVMKKYIKKTELDVTVGLGNTKLTINELRELEVGDILKLETRTTDECSVKVGDKHLFWGRSGETNNHKAIKITRKITKEE